MEAPLYNLLIKDVEFQWTEDYDKLFSNLKIALTNAPVLKGPNWEIPLHIHIDALDYTIGGVFGQREESIENSIYFINKNLQGAKFNYTIT